MAKSELRAKRASQTATHRSLGPIADLESHLPDDWWRKLFNALYVKTDGDVVENAEATQAEVDLLIQSVGLQQHQAILDLCCGQGRHALELARRGFRRVTGLDRSRYLIRLAKKRAAADRLDVVFKEGDARDPRLPEASFDVVSIMGNSFGYFSNKQDDEKVLRSAAKALRQSGTLVLDLTDGAWIKANYEPRSWEWIDQHHFVCRERSLAADGDRLISREVIVHDEMGVLADQFYAERLYDRESITALLETAGYRNVRCHGALEGRSNREQDLGMMARRILMTADAPVKHPLRTRRKQILNVSVLLGDPRLPDEVKRDGQFNPEDLRTVQKLKDALNELPGYKFTYFDNHATLQQELEQADTNLAFNLCDEGFNNDPFKELHIPALLDALEIPYTGAPPRCLATCYDKSLVRAVAVQLDIPVPQESFIRPGDHGATLPSVFPAILKPNYGDSSEGINRNAVVGNERELIAYLDEVRAMFPDRPILVQEFMQGAEYSVGLIGNPELSLTALPILEVDYSGLEEGLPHILGYESKWHPESPYWNAIRYREATLSEQLQAQLVDHAMRLFERLGCRDYGRFDFRADSDGTIKLLEVNPNPGWCWDGKQNLMAGFAGMSYSQLLGDILGAAEARLRLNGQQRQNVSATAAA